MKGISVQLYSVREAAKENYVGTVEKIAGMGYKYVEPAGYPGTTVQEAAKIFKRLGLKALSVHSALPVGENKNKSIEDAQTIGAKYIVSGLGGKDFATVEAIKQSAEKYAEACRNVRPTA
jgi:sugar phosphate isomerase/epimerase